MSVPVQLAKTTASTRKQTICFNGSAIASLSSRSCIWSLARGARPGNFLQKLFDREALKPAATAARRNASAGLACRRSFDAAGRRWVAGARASGSRPLSGPPKRPRRPAPAVASYNKAGEAQRRLRKVKSSAVMVASWSISADMCNCRRVVFR